MLYVCGWMDYFTCYLSLTIPLHRLLGKAAGRLAASANPAKLGRGPAHGGAVKDHCLNRLIENA